MSLAFDRKWPEMAEAHRCWYTGRSAVIDMTTGTCKCALIDGSDYSCFAALLCATVSESGRSKTNSPICIRRVRWLLRKSVVNSRSAGRRFLREETYQHQGVSCNLLPRSQRCILLSGGASASSALARIKIRHTSGCWISLSLFGKSSRNNLVQASISLLSLLADQSEALV
jgi:hypothetical protein